MTSPNARLSAVHDPKYLKFGSIRVVLMRRMHRAAAPITRARSVFFSNAGKVPGTNNASIIIEVTGRQ